jgi:hypothetical protein
MIAGVVAEELLLPQIVHPDDGLIDYAYYAIYDPNWVDPDSGSIGGVPPDKQGWISWWDPFTIFPPPQVLVAGYFLFESLFDEGDTVYPPYVSDGHQGIYPDLLVEIDTIYAFGKAYVTAIVATIVIDIDGFYSPTVISKVLGPQRVIDVDIFGGVKQLQQGKATINQTFPLDEVYDFDIIYGSVIGRSGVTLIVQQQVLATDTETVFINETTTSTAMVLGTFVGEHATFTAPPAGALLAHTVIDADGFYAPGIQGPLALPFFQDTDVFYAPIRLNYVLPGIAIDADAIMAPALGRVLQPSIVTDVDVFRGPAFTQPGSFSLVIDNEFISIPTVTPQRATVLPGLPVDTDAFYSPGGGQGITGVSDVTLGADTVFAPSANIGPLFPVVSVVDPDIFLVPGVLAGLLTASIVIDADTFFAPGFPVTLGGAFVSDTGAIFAPTAAQGLSPDVFSDADAFYVPVFSTSDSLPPGIVVDVDTVLAPTIIPGAVTALPGFINADDVVPVTSITVTAVLSASFVTDSDVVYAPTEGAIGQPAAFVDADAFYGPKITQVGFDGTLVLDGPIMPSTPQPTVIYIEG